MNGIKATRHIVLDTETTGLSPKTAAVTEIAAIVGYIDGDSNEFVEESRFQSLSKPRDEYLGVSANKALEITQITRAMLKAAPADVLVADIFHAWIKEWVRNNPVLLHSFNNSFDSGMLDNDRWRIPKWVWGDCIMLKAMGIMGSEGALIRRYGKWKYPNLEEARVFWKIEPPEGAAHRAMFDTEIATEIFSALYEEGVISE